MKNDSLLLIPKGNYIIMSFAYYCVYTFRSLFLEFYLGDKSKDGLYGAACALGTFSGGLFWARCADRTGDFTGILILCSVLSSLTFFSMFWLTPWSVGLFWISLSAFFVYSFFQASFPSLTDSLTLKSIPDKSVYGRQRLFGTVAYGIITSLMNFLCTQYGWISVFPAICLLNLLFILYIFCFLSNPAPAEKEAGQAVQSSSLGYWYIARRKRFVYVMVIVFLVGYVRGIFTVFLSRYQRDVIGATTLVSTLATNAGIVLEIPVFFWGGQILSSLGVDNSLLMALFLGLCRILGYIMLSFGARSFPGRTILWGTGICALELFKGPIFALTHGAAIKIVLSETPVEVHGRAQALYTVTYNNLSMLFGSLTGQLLNNWLGPKKGQSGQDEASAVFLSGNVLFGVTAALTIVAMVMAGGRMAFDKVFGHAGEEVKREGPEGEVVKSEGFEEKEKEKGE